MITIIFNGEKIHEIEQDKVKEVILPPAKRKTVGKNLFAKNYTIANNLIEKGYQVARISENKFDGEKFIYWFYNTAGLNKDLRLENKKYDSQQEQHFNDDIDDEIENFDIENIAEV